ncbi:hypothetical protein BN871_BY_00140 [Paenibacillus sp. P22]|nr:hypothetical protein BN871_BY_00140 [Paenibacillus sp. P22]
MITSLDRLYFFTRPGLEVNLDGAMTKDGSLQTAACHGLNARREPD